MALVWRPHPGQQTHFLSSNAYEALFGGAAGPGKTDCLLMEAMRQIAHPAYRGILFRRIFPSLEAADGLIDRSLRWYPAYGGKYNASKHVWEFPTGARIYFGHMQRDKDRLQYQGAQFAFIGFDELTEFLLSQYTYMMTRNRADQDSGLRVYMRSATNPGGIGHKWVKERFIVKDIVNRVRSFALIDGVDVEVEPAHQYARSRGFFPALLTDNPSIADDYIRNLQANPDPVERARFIEGDWDIEHTEGRIYPNWSLENITTDAEYNPDLPVFWGADDGYVYGDGPGYANYHPRVIQFWQDNTIGGVNLFREILATGETHEETIKRALSFDYHKPRLVWHDGSAAQFGGELNKQGLHTANGTHRVVEGIKYIRSLICDGNGIRLLKVHPRCENMIFEMSEYRSDPRERSQGGELIPLKVSDHSQDTARYALYKRGGGR